MFWCPYILSSEKKSNSRTNNCKHYILVVCSYFLYLYSRLYRWSQVLHIPIFYSYIYRKIENQTLFVFGGFYWPLLLVFIINITFLFSLFNPTSSKVPWPKSVKVGTFFVAFPCLTFIQFCFRMFCFFKTSLRILIIQHSKKSIHLINIYQMQSGVVSLHFSRSTGLWTTSPLWWLRRIYFTYSHARLFTFFQLLFIWVPLKM